MKRIITNQVVVATGAWSGRIGDMLGIRIPISPRKGHLAISVPLSAGYIRHKTLFSAGYLDAVAGKEGLAVACNIQQTTHGNLLLGSSRQFVGFDRRVDPGVMGIMLQQSVRFFPSLENIQIIRTWNGFRPYTPDILPIISPVKGTPGLFIAAGHEGLGITEGPITGKLISQLLCTEKPEIDLDALSFERFDHPVGL